MSMAGFHDAASKSNGKKPTKKMLYMYKPLTVTAIYPFDKNPTREEWEDYDYMMRRAGSSNKYALPLKNPDHLEHSGISRNI